MSKSIIVSKDSDILKFKRFSTWWTVLFNILTSGFYSYHWMYNRNKVLSDFKHVNKPNMIWSYLAMIFFIGSFIVDSRLGAKVIPSQYLEPLSIIFLLAAFVFYLVVLIPLRRNLLSIVHVDNQDFKLNPVLAFLWSGMYFQFKINQVIDSTLNTKQQAEQ